MAQRITRLTTNQKIADSNPAVVEITYYPEPRTSTQFHFEEGSKPVECQSNDFDGRLSTAWDHCDGDSTDILRILPRILALNLKHTAE